MSVLAKEHIALIGGGNMAEALIGGLVKTKQLEPSQLFATDVSMARQEYLNAKFHVRVGSNNLEAAAWASIVILAVKPQVMDEVLREIQEVAEEKTVFVSVAAGYPIDRVLEHLGHHASVIRAMPNTPSMVLAGATALAMGPGVSERGLELASTIFQTVGVVVHVEESLLDAVTGLSGSGPAYIAVVIEALTDGGVRMGLPRPTAQALAIQTVLGTAKLIQETEDHPGVLKDRVTSPGGTTIAGLHRLEQGRLRATIMDAVEAATCRSRELGR